MWKIREIKQANALLDHIDLISDRMSCKVFPNLGGSLQQLTVDNIDVIDGITIDESGLEDYRNSFKSSILFPFPNRVKDGRYVYGEKTYQLDVNDTYFKNAIHGLVYDRSFTFHKELNNPEKARLELKYSAEGDHSGFPFAYELRLVYTFSNTGKLSLSFKVKNTGFQSFPFGLGWHPYFRSGNLSQSTLAFEAKDHFVCRERMIPEEKEEAGIDAKFALGDLTFDDGYSLETPACTFDTPDYQLRLEFDTGVESYLQIYTPPHRSSLALEPMTCIADAFNNGVGLDALDPGQQYQWTINVTLRVK
jgi:aldose 1-epimerase